MSGLGDVDERYPRVTADHKLEKRRKASLGWEDYAAHRRKAWALALALQRRA
jgi:hypothetical protein